MATETADILTVEMSKLRASPHAIQSKQRYQNNVMLETHFSFQPRKIPILQTVV